MQLRDLQLAFLKAYKENENDEFTDQIVDDVNFSSLNRVKVYKGSITASLTRALKQIFPVCLKLVGDEYFTAMSEVYIHETPSTSPDLGDYGEAFATFIENFPPAKSLPYLPDVARLEWAWHCAFCGPDAARLDFEALSKVYEQANEMISFTIPENATLLASKFPIDKIWETNQDDYSGNDVVNLDGNEVRLMVWRRGFDVLIESLAYEEWFVMNMFVNGLKLHELLQHAEQYQIELDLVSVLPKLTSKGWLTGFNVTKE